MKIEYIGTITYIIPEEPIIGDTRIHFVEEEEEDAKNKRTE